MTGARRRAPDISKQITIPYETAVVTALAIPEDAGGSEIHIILEVHDRSEIVPMYDYHRLVISVVDSGG